MKHPTKPTAKYRRRPSIGPRLLEGMNEFKRALESGEPLGARFTIRTVSLPDDPAPYSPADVRAVRASLRASQPVFAALVGVSPKLVQAWEQGGREPSRTVRRLLDDIRESPQRWARRFGLSAPIADVAGRVGFDSPPSAGQPLRARRHRAG